MTLAALAEVCGIGGAGGELRGRCVVCGRFVHNGLQAEFGDKFTSWQYLQSFPDGVLCPPCHTMLTDPQWRRSHWMLSPPEGVRWLQRSEIRQLVRIPPSPPYALYTTASFKKHGWIVLQQHVNFDTSVLRFAWDEQVFAVQRSELLEMLDFVEALLARGWGRKELASEWKLQHVSQEPERYRRWKSFRLHPVWLWVVWCAEVGQNEQKAGQPPAAPCKQYSLL